MSRPRLIVRVGGLVLFTFGLTGGLLFGAAGSLHWWEAWVYLTGLCVLMCLGMSYLVVFSPDLVERRLRLREKEAPQQVITKLGFVVVIVECLVAGLEYRFGGSKGPLAIIAIGDMAAFAGYGILFLAMRENPWAARTIEIEKDQTVVSTGLYAIVRHPMYLGVTLIYGSLPLALGVYWSLIPALFLFALMIVRTLTEETVLLRDLAGYREYMNRVRWRIVPWIW